MQQQMQTVTMKDSSDTRLKVEGKVRSRDLRPLVTMKDSSDTRLKVVIPWICRQERQRLQ